MNNPELLKKCIAEEKELVFDRFSREDAFELGCLLYENSKRYPDPCCFEITVNGLVVFRYFPQGSIPDSELWLKRKRNSVNLMHMSTLHFMAWLTDFCETLEDRKLDPKEYAAGGGGFPIILSGTGVIGSICVSGMPDHMLDHQLIVDSVAQFLKGKTDTK